MASYTLGIDYGTNSVRAVVVDISDGSIVGSQVYDYPTGDQGVIEHLRQYAEAPLRDALKDVSSIADDRYDWSLNDAR